MHPKDIPIAGFRYDLPQERIAYYPLAERDSSKLLIYREGEIRQDSYRNLAGYLPENSLLVFNDTKVVEARIVFSKPSGGQIEVFCSGAAARICQHHPSHVANGKGRLEMPDRRRL